jgi:pimeloyl-ACP methyl ester carboxylesterase
MSTAALEESVVISVGPARLEADLHVPADAAAIVIFAHGSGSSRFSSRNRAVATHLNRHRIATLLLDLLTREEEAVDERTREFRFDIPRLADRVGAAAGWVRHHKDLQSFPVGCFGASTGAAAALIAAADHPDVISAVVSRGGRPDLAGAALTRVQAPTLLIVGSRDEPVITMNRDAAARMSGEVQLEIVPGATHLFEEPGTLEQVMELATGWFVEKLKP